MLESLRRLIDDFLIGANRSLYGWKTWLAEMWNQGSYRTLILLFAALAVLALFLLVRWLKNRRQASLFCWAAEQLARASSPDAVATLLFQAIFKTTSAKVAGIYLAPTAEGPFPLRGNQSRSSVPVAALPDWELKQLLDTIPKLPSVERHGALRVVSLPVAVEGEGKALVQFPLTGLNAANKIISRTPFLISLFAPIVAQLAALARIQRLEEQAREASVLAGSSQLLVGATLGIDRLANTLLDLAIRSSQSDGGLIFIKSDSTNGEKTEVISPKGLDASVLGELGAVLREEAFSLASEKTLVDRIQPDSRFHAILNRAGFAALVQAPIFLDASPVGRIFLLKREGTFRESHFRICQLNARRLGLTLKNRKYHEEVFSEYKDTLLAMVHTLESSGHFQEGHSARVSRLSAELAKGMGLEPAEVEGIKLAGDLHDVGMVGLGDEILLRAGKLTEKEYDVVKHHPTIGAALTAPIRLPIAIAPLVLHHHERYDGQGYPAGLRGAAIPLGARILGLGEVFDALITSRAYRKGLDFPQAVERLRSLAGTQLDREIVDLFVRVMPADRWQTIVKHGDEFRP
jgi:HD-GYP domain-containing protein (c-di-GMP phosphodiesterase class II)